MIAERKWRSYNRLPGQEQQGRRSRGNERPPTNGTTEGAPGATGADSGTNQPKPTGFRGEANRLNIKCFNCHKKGHLAANCPELTCKRKILARVIKSGEEKRATDEKPDPWLLTISAEGEHRQPTTGTLPR